MVEMVQNDYTNQIVYQTNADYFASYEKMKDAQSTIIASLDQTEKGIIWFRLVGTKTIFTLSPKGKLQVRWNDLSEKQVLLKIVQSLLVPKHGQKLEITPTSQHAFISYPPPEDFKLYWCEEETVYSKKSKKGIIGQFFEEYEKRAEKKHRERLIELEILNRELMLNEDEYTLQDSMEISRKVRKESKKE